MASDNNLIPDYHFNALAQANRLLAKNWNVLSKMRANGGLEDISRLIEAEIVYFQSIQLVWDAGIALCKYRARKTAEKGMNVWGICSSTQSQ